ncbi:serine protease [Sphingomonas sp. CJ20]
MTEAAIPLTTSILPGTADKHVAGSGFLAKLKGGYWLLTAAHVPIGVPQHNDWTRWPEKLILVRAEGSGSIDLPLFQITGAVRAPIFRHWYQASGQMHDFLAYPVSKEFARGLPEYQVFDIAAGKAGKKGMSLVVRGHPTADNPWPHRPSRSLRAQALGEKDGLLLFSPPPSEGFSGGPVLTAAGKLAGMTIGFDGQTGQAASVTWIKDVLPR